MPFSLKKQVVLLLALLCGRAAWAAPVADFETDSIDAGLFTEESDRPEVTFSFCSVGDTELEYRRIVTSCGVEILHFLKAEAEAEYTGDLSVRLDLRGLPNGRFCKHIYLYGNAPTKRLVVHGEVKFPVKVIIPAQAGEHEQTNTP